MSYRTLIVHLDDSQRCRTRTALALALSARWNAHLIGLYVVCQDLLEPLRRPGEPLALGEYERLGEQRRTAAEQRFLAAAEAAGRSVQWQAPAGDAVRTVIRHAHHADLMLLGQEDPNDRLSHVAGHFVEDVVMGAGRPILVLPRAGAVASCGENVLVGWDGKREAARALADALPLLAHAHLVNVVTVEHGGTDPDAPAGVDVAAYLERHRVRAAFSTVPRERAAGTGASLLDRAAELHADLIVMGLYSHARRYERILGGATRTVLDRMTVPVLFSH
ncbi:universal stress protein [Burkholderia glumae]|uniref:Universal stress protein n=1 Tax=Burkholderia glumae TaxID=337 RepID=A0AAP9XVI5_BURGL|nr:universal stress protein [Burkholderia glumae]ACR32357.1 UspA domain-containing protein [Burkholderia glumae BGR1]AJY63091.1 universal stress family protein [Burkholderia glumae LMG 2196 = ATCC 33617]KHJ63211.1 universal stress protein UspA [Burkholderia glumae]MCM2484447.1 universal stress protein [Burkholderia glumae]MCM2510139.1 universal stress protein [Burkholderia glumae]